MFIFTAYQNYPHNFNPITTAVVLVKSLKLGMHIVVPSATVTIKEFFIKNQSDAILAL